MKSFVIDSFNGGISDFESKGIKGSFKFGKNLDIRKKVDSLSCQQALIAEQDINDEVLYWIVPASDGLTYGFNRDGKIYKRTSGGVWTQVYEGVSGAIKGAAEWFSSAGKSYLYWVDGNDDLHRKELPGVSNWSDVDADVGWPKTDLTTADWHTMRQANGALMICNDQYLAMVGYDNSYTSEAVDLIRGNVTKTLIERQNYVVAGTGKKDTSEKAELFVWEQTALSWVNKKQLPAKGINALIDTEVPLAQVGSEGGIYFSDLVNVLQVHAFPGGGYVNPDGVDVDDGVALFGVYGNGSGNNGIYSYGRRTKNAPFVLNLEYQFDSDLIGSVKKVGSDILVSYNSESPEFYGVKKVDTANKAIAVYESLDLKAPHDLPARPVNWAMVKLVTAPISSGTSISLKYKVNKSGSWTTALLQDESSSFDDVGETEAVFLVGADGKIFEFQITLTPTGNISPEVYRAEIFFE